MSLETKEAAVCEWVNSFLHEHVESFADLSDGLVFGQILGIVSARHFGQLNSAVDRDAITNSPVLAAKYVKTLVGLVLTYFKDEFKKSVDTSDIDSALIARNKDPKQILRVLELVVGAVVMCERKDEFIGKIFDLSRAAQRVLKTIVEAFMHSLKDYTPENSPRTQPQELTKALGVVKHLRGERETLVKELNNLKVLNLELHTRVEDLNNSLKNAGGASKYRSNTAVIKGGGEEGVTTNINKSGASKAEVDELRRELDEKSIENNILKEQLQQALEAKEASQKDASQSQGRIADMEEAVADAKGQALKLAKAESTLLKYQQRLDEFAALKREHKGLKERLEVYVALEQQLEEAQARGEAAAEQLAESQKQNKALQSEKSAFASLLVDKEEELEEALKHVETLESAAAATVTATTKEEGEEVEEQDDIEDVEIEGPPSSPSHMTDSAPAVDDSAALEALRQKLVDAEAELEESRESSERVQEEKELLETFSRESMQAFKDKFTNTLKNLTEEKEMLEGALERLADRAEFDRETFRREERLLLSAVHGLGVDIMSMNVKRLVARNPMPMTGDENAGVSPQKSVLAETQSRQMLALDSLIE